MKRHLIAALVLVSAVVVGALGFLGRHFDDMSRSVDAWLTEAGYQLQNEPIDPERAVTQVAEATLPIAVFIAGGLVLVLIWLVLHRTRKGLPGSRRRRRTKRVAQGSPRESKP